MLTSAVWILYFIAYGYGFLSTLIISLISQLGVITILFSYNNQIAKYLIALLIAVGVSSLVSDAILHLIPEVIITIFVLVFVYSLTGNEITESQSNLIAAKIYFYQTLSPWFLQVLYKYGGDGA